MSSPDCVWTNSHTYLQAAELRLLVSCQLVIFKRFKSGYIKQNKYSVCGSFSTSSALHFHVAPFDFASCDRIIYCADRTEASGNRRPGWKGRLFYNTKFIYSHDGTRHFERSHMICASVTVNGFLLDHFGIEKLSSRRITFARTKNRIFPFPQYSIDHSLKYLLRLRSWQVEVSKFSLYMFLQCRAEEAEINVFVMRTGSLRASNWDHDQKKTCIHTCVAETKVFLFTCE